MNGRPHSSEPARAPVSTALVTVLALLCAAPTVGDVGSCGEQAVRLEATSFWTQRAALECRRCRACRLRTPTCTRACDPRAEVPTSFPAGCHPLVHDGEVCLRSLEAQGCDDFEKAMAEPPIVPTECDFCPVGKEPSGT